MSNDPNDLYNKVFVEFLENVKDHDLATDAASAAMKNLKTFSECRPPDPEPQPEPTPEPTTFWERTKAGTARVWDNETTRVLIKAGGAFAGVALVAYSTIHKDHVMERQALAQANQRNS
jgi:hypothetical protein